MKTNLLKIALSVFSVIILLFTSNTNAQSEQKYQYYFVTVTAFDEGKIAIVTEVRRANCGIDSFYTYEQPIKNQFSTYLQANYKKWHIYKFTRVQLFKNQVEAEKKRVEIIAEYNRGDYTVTKDSSYKYYCD